MDAAITNLLDARPQRAAHCTVEPQHGAGASAAYVLKDGGRQRYMLLSDEGLFLWQLLDGERSVREVCGAYAAHYGRPAPREVMPAMARFCEAGFVGFGTVAGSRADVQRPRGRRAIALALCTRYWALPDIDRTATALHRLFRPLFAPMTQGVLLLIALAGLLAFARHLGGVLSPTAPVPGALAASIASFVVQIAIHEAAHALTCKHFGRGVHRAGVGWYLFAPVAFVDTSDIWAAPRLQRMLVSAAGPYANVLLSGIAALCASLLRPDSADVVWSFSAIGYMFAVINMNPLLELDGYYIVMDLLDVPNLRARALAYLGKVLQRTAQPIEERRLGVIFLTFGAACLVYGVVVALGIALAGHAIVTSLAGPYLPPVWLQAISWPMAGATSLLLLARLIGCLTQSSTIRQ
jgi:putative peptide zinc metalloprotease protein